MNVLSPINPMSMSMARRRRGLRPTDQVRDRQFQPITAAECTRNDLTISAQYVNISENVEGTLSMIGVIALTVPIGIASETAI